MVLSEEIMTGRRGLLRTGTAVMSPSRRGRDTLWETVGMDLVAESSGALITMGTASSP